MGTRTPFLGVEDTADQDDSYLLNEDRKSNGKYDKGSSFRSRLKLIIAGFSIVGLIVLGVVIGAVFGKRSRDENAVGLHARKDNFPYKKIRLPVDVLPLKYRVFLHPNITNGLFDFKGYTRIVVHCQYDTETVVMHMKGLKILNVTIFKGEAFEPEGDKNKETVPIKDYLSSDKHEFLMLRLDDAKLFKDQKYTILIKYHGKLATDILEGFYRSSYKTKNGETRYLATTHFEATSARSAFPCFDEPQMKANFSVVIVHESHHTAISNMPIMRTDTREDGLKITHFQESVRMSTYLVAFVVCDFVFKNVTAKSGVEIRVYAPKEQIEQTQFAIDTAPFVLDYYNEFFKVPFPLPKLDMIAIPDFSAGAMENWGLITYRLTSLLYDEKESSSSSQQWVAVTIAHEFAHQWFGNLVTMKWWNDLWLNEGFAAFVEFIGVDKVQPTWQMLDQFNVDDLQSALALDAHVNSHPISVPVDNPAQINEIFDTISYDKGSSIIRMMRNFTGEDAFHTGLQNYLKKYQFSNAETDDLWAELTKASGKVDVKEVMDTWTRQMGFPVVNIRRSDKDNDVAVATQSRFIVDVNAKSDQKSPYNYRWHVPLTYKTQHALSEPKFQWFNASQDTVSFNWSRSSGWLKVNLDQIGFYRVNYDGENWMALAKQLHDDHTKLSIADRAGLLDDAFDLARANLLKTVRALDLTAYLKNETEYIPWVSALGSLSVIGSMLEGRPGYAYYEKYVVMQVKPIAAKLGWNDTGSHLHKYLRGLILKSAVTHGDKDSIDQAKKIFNDMMFENARLAPNLHSAVYLAGIKYGTAKQWDFLWQKHESSNVPTEQSTLMLALADTSDKNLLKRYLSWSIDNSKIRSQDTSSLISHIALNVHGQELAYEFCKKNWQLLYERYGDGSFDLTNLIKAVFGRFKTEEMHSEVRDFFKTHKAGTGARAVKQSLASIQNNIRWLSTHENEVVNWLQKKTAE